ncbi:MAG: class II fructose-bisphosphate aldolase [Armatimonadetes bacterium]|nr:class II fructose-bisphosphate aldolase [Armatimonadota bacterium]MBS1725957.1 class II fructose-bisphosphate aldolase [Armatimonadota bacterium]
MPVPDAATFARMLDAAQKGNYALASINVTSSTTLNAALAAFAETKTDGIIQFSTGGSEFASGPIKSMSEGAIALAEYTHRVAKDLPCYVALTTDHCVPPKVDAFVRPLIAESKSRVEKGLPPLFNGHMFDGSELNLKDNMTTAKDLLAAMAPLGIILEVEAGVVGGEEDGIDNTGVGHEKLYTTPEDMLYVYDQLSPIGRFTLAATFGNVHGVYKPGNVKLNPEILREGNEAMKAKYGKILDLVFHGGSGSLLSEIHAAVDYGVVKMNVDTDCQYHYSRPVVDHVMKNYDGMLRIDGEMGDKKTYDPRSYMKKAEAGMKARVIQAATELRSVGISLVNG